MSREMWFHRRVMLGLQRVLSGEITLQIRAIVGSLREGRIDLCCCHDGDLSAETFDAMESAEGELLADFTADEAISTNLHFIRIDIPAPLPKDYDFAVFARREQHLVTQN